MLFVGGGMIVGRQYSIVMQPFGMNNIEPYNHMVFPNNAVRLYCYTGLSYKKVEAYMVIESPLWGSKKNAIAWLQ